MKFGITEKVIVGSFLVFLIVYALGIIGFSSVTLGALGGLSILIFLGSTCWKYRDKIWNMIEREMVYYSARKQAEAERRAELYAIHQEGRAWGSGVQRGTGAVIARERARRRTEREAESYRKHIRKITQTF